MKNLLDRVFDVLDDILALVYIYDGCIYANGIIKISFDKNNNLEIFQLINEKYVSYGIISDKDWETKLINLIDEIYD